MTIDPLVTVPDLAKWQAGDPQSLLDAAHAEVRRYCGWHVAPLRQETVTLTGTGSRELVLPTMRIFSVQAVNNGGIEYTAEDYTWSVGGVLRRAPALGIWVPGAPVVVTFQHGFDSAPDVQKVIAAVASRGGTSSTSGAVVRRTAGPYSEEYATSAGSSGFTADETAVLDRYRLAPSP